MHVKNNEQKYKFTSKILYTASKISKELQAFKYARNVLDKLDELVVSSKFLDEIESMSMSIKAKPFKDEEELMPLCYRCSHHNPLLNQKGNDCINCGQPFVFSFASFIHLPLVEFILPNDISDEEALALIDFVPNSQFDKDAELRQREALIAASNSRSN
jgi:intraflagellar transport protein 122